MSNPYNPKRYLSNRCGCCGVGWRATYEQMVVLRPEIQREQSRAKHWDAGRADRLSGQPCRSANGEYLECWYSVS